jgi:hypothetical protein
MAEHDLETLEVAEGKYEHFKGGIYEVLGTALHADTGETYVCYKSQETRRVYIRSSADFIAQVDRGEYSGPRFKLMDKKGK